MTTLLRHHMSMLRALRNWFLVRRARREFHDRVFSELDQNTFVKKNFYQVRIYPDGTCTYAGLSIHVEPDDLVEFGVDENGQRFLRINPETETPQ